MYLQPWFSFCVSHRHICVHFQRLEVILLASLIMAIVLANTQAHTQAHTSVAWMKKGEIVNVRGVAVEENESMTWTIEEEPKDGKVLLSCGCCGSELKLIRIAVDKVSPTTLSLYTSEATLAASETLNFQLDLPFHWKLESWIVSHMPTEYDSDADIDKYLNQWVTIPGLGGNRILLRRCTWQRRPLLMFPRLEMLGLELCFWSQWYRESTVVMEVDILKPCPAGQIWIYCAWCQKFHLPYYGIGSHRQSKKHAKARWYLDNEPAERLRKQIGSKQVEGRWL